MKKTIIFLVLLFQANSLAWTIEPTIVSKDFLQKSGKFSFVGEYSLFKTSHFWNSHAQKKDSFNKLLQNGVDVSFEYGLNEGNTLGLFANWVQNKETLNWYSSGQGDIEVWWKFYLSNIRQYVFSARFLTIIPTEKEKATIRYGEWGAELDLHCQREFVFLERKGWSELLVGYRYYSGCPSDQIKIELTSGYQLFSRLTLIGSAYFHYALLNGNRIFNGPTLVLPSRYELFKIKINGVFSITQNISTFIGGYWHVWGKGIGTGAGCFTGLWVTY